MLFSTYNNVMGNLVVRELRRDHAPVVVHDGVLLAKHIECVGYGDMGVDYILNYGDGNETCFNRLILLWDQMEQIKEGCYIIEEEVDVCVEGGIDTFIREFTITITDKDEFMKPFSWQGDFPDIQKEKDPVVLNQLKLLKQLIEQVKEVENEINEYMLIKNGVERVTLVRDQLSDDVRRLMEKF